MARMILRLLQQSLYFVQRLRSSRQWPHRWAC